MRFCAAYIALSLRISCISSSLRLKSLSDMGETISFVDDEVSSAVEPMAHKLTDEAGAEGGAESWL